MTDIIKLQKLIADLEKTYDYGLDNEMVGDMIDKLQSLADEHSLLFLKTKKRSGSKSSVQTG